MADDALVRNAADPQQVHRAGRKTRLAALQQDADLKSVYATEQGRRFLHRLLTYCGTYKSCYRGDPLETMRAVGRQELGHELVAWIRQLDPEVYLRLLREGQQASAREALENEASRIDPSDREV